MSVNVSSFGKMPGGEEVSLFTIENKNGMRIAVTDFGAILVSVFVKGKDGVERDVVLGYDKVDSYFEDGNCFGATVGPIANRTKDAKFSIDGVEYHLDKNDGENNLHTSHPNGFQKRLWNAEAKENAVSFSLKKADMDMGHPGNLFVTVTYTLTDENEIKIHYHADTDKETLINLTNHTYFNLNGHQAKEVYDEFLTLNCSAYTPDVAGAIPTGEIAPVKGTPMDFTSAKKVGEEIASGFEQLELVKGYDHNFCIDGWDHTLREFATVEDKESGIIMKCFTDLPGVQFYTGNHVGAVCGKEGVVYGARRGLCLETQYYPNSANQEGFPKPQFGPKTPYDSTTIYKFI